MNISFQNQNNRVETPAPGYPERAEKDRAAHAQERQKRGVADVANVSFSASEIGFPAFGNVEEKGRDKGKTLADIQQEAAYTDVGISQDYMTVMSHTMSEEDYQKLSEEGFHFASLDPEEAVTIVDRIKAELVKSGKQIVGYTDDLDVDTLTAAVGSEVLARAIADSFRAADIPLTEENIADVSKAWNMTVQLASPTDGTCQYLIDNELEPEIWNFYLAQNSGAGNGKSVGADFLSDANMRQQIDQMLEQSGLEPDEENRQAANWLLERDLPLTAENLERLRELQQVSFPVEETAFADAAALAISEGQSAVHADLAASSGEEVDKSADPAVPGKKKANIYEKAAEVLQTYWKAYEENLQSGDVAARRQLEEIRLRMTAEVNVKLLKSGFAIDTAPMEELITALREMEQEVAGTYFPGAEDAVARYENWNAVTEVMEELPTMPARVIGTVQLHGAEEDADASGMDSDVSGGQQEATTLSRFHAEGRALKEDYRRAGESYEALMTAPRADLGDSIRKAFSNVDDILRDMGMEVTDENRRAVRILGYNHMDIDAENMDRILAADAAVKQIIEKMTPAATLKMIRDGVNPLEQSFEQLTQYFDELPEDYREQSESYSRYLYGLEQSKGITEEERTSYIGVYRLLRQIEKSDGTAVGAVVNVQAQMQFSNLLSAVRSGKFRHMDVKASDEFGTLKELVQKGEALSIDSQISRAYEKQRLEEIREAVHTDSAVASMLLRGEVPPTAENLLVAQRILQAEGNPFRTLREKAEKLRGAESLQAATEVRKALSGEEDGAFAADAADGMIGTDAWERLDDREAFQAEYASVLSELSTVTEELTFEAAQESIDVRSLQLAHRQLSILGSLARREEYLLPMYVGEELAAVHLTLERGGAKKGGIAISVDYAQDAHLEAHLQVKDGRVEGFLLGNTPEEVTKLQQASDIFYNLIKENSSLDLETVELPVVSKGNINVTGMSEINSQEEGASPDNGMLYHVAKLFLQAIR